MNIYYKLGFISWICQWICFISQLIIGEETLFFIINILFLNTTMAFLLLGNTSSVQEASQEEING